MMAIPNQEEQDETTGKIVRERREIKQKITSLREKAQKQGRFLKDFGQKLESAPEKVAFEGRQQVSISLIGGTGWFKEAEFPQLSDIVQTTDELREAMSLRAKTDAEASRLGIE